MHTFPCWFWDRICGYVVVMKYKIINKCVHHAQHELCIIFVCRLWQPIRLVLLRKW